MSWSGYMCKLNSNSTLLSKRKRSIALLKDIFYCNSYHQKSIKSMIQFMVWSCKMCIEMTMRCSKLPCIDLLASRAEKRWRDSSRWGGGAKETTGIETCRFTNIKGFLFLKIICVLLHSSLTNQSVNMASTCSWSNSGSSNSCSASLLSFASTLHLLLKSYVSHFWPQRYEMNNFAFSTHMLFFMQGFHTVRV